MEIDQPLLDEFEKYGRVWLRNAISDTDLSLFDLAMSDQAKAGQRMKPSAALGTALSGGHSLLNGIQKLAHDMKPVRIISFDKSEHANWGVPWHQDRVIAVAGRAEVAGYRNWTKKSDTWHCEPPQAVLDEMLFVRVHLDDTDQSNGAMEIAVGSHMKGIVPSSQAEEEAQKYPVEVCEAKRGDVLVLKMLTLHSSKPAHVYSGRRVLRIDFSASKLPPPLSWIGPIGEKAPA